MDTKVLDWGQPLEAFDGAGNVVPVRPIKEPIDGTWPDRDGQYHMMVMDSEDGTLFFANEDGTSWGNYSYTIRNVVPATPTRTALEQRMEALIRLMAKEEKPMNVAHNAYTEARAILAELEPVDPMLLEARKIVADQYGDSNNVSHLRAAALSGDGDEWFHTKVAIAALSRGRALERGE